ALYTLSLHDALPIFFMFETLRQSLKVGVITERYPETAWAVSSRARGRPEIDWANWRDARPGAAVCPTGAISYEDQDRQRVARLRSEEHTSELQSPYD